VLATKLFRGIAPEFFGSLSASLFTLFQVMTVEGWPDIARGVREPVVGSHTQRIDPLGGPAETTTELGAVEHGQGQIRALRERLRGMLALLPAVGIAQRSAFADGVQRVIRFDACGGDGDGIDGDEQSGDAIDVARAGVLGDAAGDRVRRALEACRGADVVERLVDLRTVVADAGALEDVQPGQAIAVVDARPLVEVEERAAALAFRRLALLHRERVHARLARRAGELREVLDERRRALPVFVAPGARGHAR